MAEVRLALAAGRSEPSDRGLSDDSGARAFQPPEGEGLVDRAILPRC